MKKSALRFGFLILLLGLMWSFAGCAGRGKVEDRQVKFKETPSPSVKGQFPNWQFPPRDLEEEFYRRMIAGDLRAKTVRMTAHGTTGAFKIVTYDEITGDEITFKFKKVVPGWLDSFNTSPRKELAAYAVQKFFLDPEDYVVPTPLAICANRERAMHFIGYVAPSLEGTNCVLGLVSVWMENVTIPDKLYDESRFLEDSTYAYYMSNFNILTYLIQHRDARVGQFLVSKDEKRRQVFSIDNGIAFGFWPYNFLIRQWDEIHLPALRRDSIVRLRSIKRQDLDHLGVLAQLQKDEDGILQPVLPGEDVDPDNGATYQDGTVQFGLTKSEIDDLWERIQTLIAEVDAGKIQVF